MIQYPELRNYTEQAHCYMADGRRVELNPGRQPFPLDDEVNTISSAPVETVQLRPATAPLPEATEGVLLIVRPPVAWGSIWRRDLVMADSGEDGMLRRLVRVDVPRPPPDLHEAHLATRYAKEWYLECSQIRREAVRDSATRMTQRGIAEILGISQTQVWRILHGREIT